MLRLYRRFFPKKSIDGLVLRYPKRIGEAIAPEDIWLFVGSMVISIAIIAIIAVFTDPPGWISFLCIIFPGFFGSRIHLKLLYRSYLPPLRDHFEEIDQSSNEN